MPPSVWGDGAEMLLLGGLAPSLDAARDQLVAAHRSGAATDRFQRMVTALNGPADLVEQFQRHLPVADDNGKLLGLLSIRNLLEWQVDDLSHELDSLEQYVSNDGPGG